MVYKLEVSEQLHKAFSKLAKRNKRRLKLINNKVNQILEYPKIGKPLKKPLQNRRRVHINKSYVLIYSIDQKRKVIKLLEFEHHKRAYK